MTDHVLKMTSLDEPEESFDVQLHERRRARAEANEVLNEANEVLALASIPGRVSAALDEPVAASANQHGALTHSNQAEAAVAAAIKRETVLFSCHNDPVLDLLLSTRVDDAVQRKVEVRRLRLRRLMISYHCLIFSLLFFPLASRSVFLFDFAICFTVW